MPVLTEHKNSVYISKFCFQYQKKLVAAASAMASTVTVPWEESPAYKISQAYKIVRLRTKSFSWAQRVHHPTNSTRMDL